MIKITIFTPTYNRADTLSSLYDSIIRQKYSNFEWVIVDDGSSDNTKEVVKKWINENKVDIKYFYQKNSGKHIAINKGVKEANGTLFIIVDSDDYLTDNALAIIDKWYKTIKSSDDRFAGIGGRKIYTNGNLIGTSFKDKEFLDITSLERREHNILGDKAEVFFTDILRNYPFPKIDDERFFNEAYIWNKIAKDGYKLRWINEDLIVCEYRDDGITKNRDSISMRSPKGTLMYLKQLINDDKGFVRKVAHYASYCKIAKSIYSDKEIMKQLNINWLSLKMFVLISKIRSCINK